MSTPTLTTPFQAAVSRAVEYRKKVAEAAIKEREAEEQKLRGILNRQRDILAAANATFRAAIEANPDFKARLLERHKMPHEISNALSYGHVIFRDKNDIVIAIMLHEMDEMREMARILNKPCDIDPIIGINVVEQNHDPVVGPSMRDVHGILSDKVEQELRVLASSPDTLMFQVAVALLIS
ncbi:MAG TPA: hypothetical protein VFT82_00185 [Candidatus Paceibacterota bacterium]|nr:hypothetical protein [Candidatus Paceibacterota bacterium]